MAGRPNRGTRVVTFRPPPELLAEIDQYCATASVRRKEGEYTRTEFLLAALREKLDHIARSNRLKKRDRKSVRAADNVLKVLQGLARSANPNGDTTAATKGTL